MPTTPTVGWDGWPDGVADGSRSSNQYWSFCIQAWWALRERHAVFTGNWQFPPCNISWDDGTVGGINASGGATYTVSMSNVHWETDGATCSSERWVDYACSSIGCPHQLDYLPRDYDLIIEIDRNDPFTAVRGSISAQTYDTGAHTGTLTISDTLIKDAITAKYIPNLDALVGAKWYIIKRGGLWNTDRIPEKPDDRYLWSGSNSIGGLTEQQTITMNGSPTGGTFAIRYNGSDGSLIPFNASAGAVLTGMPSAMAGQVSGVTGPNGGPWVVARDRPAGDYYLVAGANALTGGSSPAISFGSITTASSFLRDTSPVKTSPVFTRPVSYVALPVNPWVVNQWVAIPGLTPPHPAKDVLFYGDDGYLHRQSITFNSASDANGSGGAIHFAKQTYNASGAYIVVDHNGVGKPGRTFTPMNQWYTGKRDDYVTHLPTNAVGTRGIPKQFDGWPVGDFCDGLCEDNSTILFDNDYFIDITESCSGSFAGDSRNPNVARSLRYLQKTIVDYCNNFVDPKNHDADLAINPYTPATFFLSLGINAWKTGVTFHAAGQVNITGTPDGVEFPIPIYWTSTNSDLSESAGIGTLLSSGVLEATFPGDVVPDKDVVLSLGFTRYKPRQFRYLYPKTCIIPTDATDPPTASGDPVECKVGTWTTRPASTHYVRWGTGTGIIGDGTIPFTDKVLARYIGDNSQGPGIFDNDDIAIPSGAPGIVTRLVPYYDKFYRGTFAPQDQQDKQDSLIGTVASGQPGRITDPTKNWWSDIFTGPAWFTDAGTATGGSRETLVDTGHIITGTSNPLSCYWNPDRFPGDAPYAGFILEVKRAAAGTVPELNWRTVITSTDTTGTGVTFNFNHSSSHTGYVITCNGSGGTFSISHGADTGSPVAYNATAPQVMAGMPSSVLDLICEVTGAAGGPWLVSFNEDATLTIDASAIIGGSADIGDSIDLSLSPTSGDTWKVREPSYEINKWQGRNLELTNRNGSTYVTGITHSDDVSLYFGALFNKKDNAAPLHSPSSGWTYKIIEPDCGSVFRFNASEGIHVIATGKDERRPWVLKPEDFKDDPKSNREDLVKDYGFVTPCDFLNHIVYNEIYRSINRMVASIIDITEWTSRHKADVPESNHLSLGSITEPTFTGYTFDNGTGLVDAGFPPFPSCAHYFYDWRGAYAAARSDVLIYIGAPGTDQRIYCAADDAYYPPSGATGDTLAISSISEDVSSTPPYKYARGEIHEFQDNTQLNGDVWGHMGENGGASVESAYKYAKISNMPKVLTATVDFYNYATSYKTEQDWEWTYHSNSPYNAHGATGTASMFESSGDLVYNRKWRKWSSASVDNVTHEVISDKLGDPATGQLPDLEPDPAKPTNDYEWDASAISGYKVIKALGIAHWDFQYI